MVIFPSFYRLSELLSFIASLGEIGIFESWENYLIYPLGFWLAWLWQCLISGKRR